MTRVTAFLVVCFLASSGLAHDTIRLKALEKRIAALEEAMAKLTADTAPAVAKAGAEDRVNAQRAKARERMRQDMSVYSRDELREIETLYQVANKKWRTQEGKDSLKKLIEKYDKANRTGCALLYLGQMSQGKEREAYLRRAIEGFSDCFYGDGVQVGAYARYYLAYYYKEAGDAEKAEALFEEIRTRYPDAISHKGKFLSDAIGK